MRFIDDRHLLPGLCRRGALAAATLLVAACASPRAESYYPLEAGRSWTYAMAIRPASGQAVRGNNEVRNLPEQTLAGQTVTPQATAALGQRRLRFIAGDDRAVVEIADQDGTASEPRIKDPPNTILKMPLIAGANWQTTWETNQFGQRTLLPITKTVESTGRPCTAGTSTFRKCLHLRLAGSEPVSAGDRSAIVDVAGEEWFVPAVGYVRGLFSEQVRGLPQNDIRVEVTMTDSTP